MIQELGANRFSSGVSSADTRSLLGLPLGKRLGPRLSLLKAHLSNRAP